MSAVQVAVSSQGSRAQADASTGAAGLFVPAVGRLLDTRNGTGGYSSAMPAGGVRTVTAAGRAGIPASGVSALALTLTAVGAGTIGSISVAPGDVATPTGAALVFNPGDSVSNTALGALHADGTLHVLADHAVNLIIDVQGYFTSGNSTAAGGFVPLNPARLADTRSGLSVPQAKVASGGTVTVQAAGQLGIPGDASALYVNITVLSPPANGYLRAYAAGSSVPTTNALDFDNSTMAQSVAVPVSADGRFTVLVGAGGPVDLIIDLEGYYTSTGSASGGAFTPAAVHLLDTRAAPVRTLAANSVSSFTVAGLAGMPNLVDGLTAVALNVRTVQSADSPAGGYLRLWPSDEAEPATSSVNYTGQNIYRTNLVNVAPADDGTISVRNGGAGPVDIVLDVEGWYSSGPLSPQVTSSAVRALDWISPTAALPFHFATSSLAAPVAGYIYNYDEQPAVTVTGSTADVTVLALSLGHHVMSVVATDALGLQSPSQSLDFGVGSVTGTVQNLNVQPANGSVMVRWAAPADLGGALPAEVSYNVELIDAASGNYMVGGGCTGSCVALVMPRLDPSLSYRAKVSTHTGAGDSVIAQSDAVQPLADGTAASCGSDANCATWAPGATDDCAAASVSLTSDWICQDTTRTVQTTDAAGNPQVLQQDVTNGATANVTGMTADEADAAFTAAESQAVTLAQPARLSSYQASYNTNTVLAASQTRSARYQSKRTTLIVFHVGNHWGVVTFYHGLNIQWHSVDVTMRYGSPIGDAISLNWKERLRHEKGFGGDSTLAEFGSFGSSLPSSQARTEIIDAWNHGYQVLPYHQYTVFLDAYSMFLRWGGTGMNVLGSAQSEHIKCYKTVSCKF
ncbi:MAG: hypothetical protein ABI047_16690 [Jatrophihabitantaceae bacterium]